MARPDKAAAVAELTEQFRSASAAVLTEYRGLTVAQLKELRRSLGEQTSYAVVKNTLTRIAARDAGVDALDTLLQGPSAIAFVTGDPVEAAKGLRDFARAHPLLVIKGGVMEGRALSPDDIRKLADLESREVLLARLAGALKGSLQGAVSLFAAPLSQTARVVEALRQKAAEDPTVLRGGAGRPAADTGSATAESAPVDSPTADSPTADSPTADSPPADSPPAGSPPADSPTAEASAADSAVADAPAAG